MYKSLGMVAGILLFPFLTAQTAEDKQKRADTGGMPDLVSGLNATEGCIGVKTARFSDGKNAIFAWFENKEAVLRWYYSDMHQQTMKSFGNDNFRKPLEHLHDHKGPIMVIASITMAKENKIEGSPMPISQIAIELYEPLPGGAFINDRLGPAALKVEGMADYSKRESAATESE
ncbi:MAG: hypothetical protein AB7N71_02085 [Phycisphaerae bacterium]